MPPLNNNAILHQELIAKDFARLYESLSFPITSQSQFEEAWDNCNLEYIHYAGSTPMTPYIDAHIREVFNVAAAYLYLTSDLSPYAVEFGVFLVAYLFFTQPGLPLMTDNNNNNYDEEGSEDEYDNNYYYDDDENHTIADKINMERRQRRNMNQRRRREEEKRRRYLLDLSNNNNNNNYNDNNNINLLEETSKEISTARLHNNNNNNNNNTCQSNIPPSSSHTILTEEVTNNTTKALSILDICQLCPDLYRINISLDCYSLLVKYIEMNMIDNTEGSPLMGSLSNNDNNNINNNNNRNLSLGEPRADEETVEYKCYTSNITSSILAEVMTALDNHAAWSLKPAVDYTIQIGSIIKAHQSSSGGNNNINNNNSKSLFDITKLRDEIHLESDNFRSIVERRRVIQRYLLIQRQLRQEKEKGRLCSNSTDDYIPDYYNTEERENDNRNNINNNNNNNKSGATDIVELQKLLAFYSKKVTDGIGDNNNNNNHLLSSMHDDGSSNIIEMANKYFQDTKGLIR